MSDRPTRYFTPEEANGLIPALSLRLSRCGDLLRQFKDLTERAREDETRRAELLAEARAAPREADEIFSGIITEGIQVKGVEPALLDFPALRNGQAVFL